MSARLHVDLDLIRKYDVPGPRYTSYPTAVEFTEHFSRDALLLDLRANNQSPTADFALFPSAVLRNALLVLRLHDHHRSRPRSRGHLPRLPGQRARSDGEGAPPGQPRGAGPLRRRHAQLSVAQTDRAPGGHAPRTLFLGSERRDRRRAGPPAADTGTGASVSRSRRESRVLRNSGLRSRRPTGDSPDSTERGQRSRDGMDSPEPDINRSTSTSSTVCLGKRRPPSRARWSSRWS